MTSQQQSHYHPQKPGGSGVVAGRGGGSIDDAIGTDLVHTILSRLSASSFASAACVSRTWNSICSRILSVPKLSCAVSLNPSLQGAVNEVVEKVLSEPLRPHFVIASIGTVFDLSEAHQLITGRFGSSVPVITSISDGIIGRDALTDEFKEVRWEIDDNDDPYGSGFFLPNQGIVLTVGYVPGLRATLIPLQSPNEAPKKKMIDEFVADIRKFAFAVPDMAPSAIILFSDLETDMRPVLQKLDYVFPWDTVIVGEGGGRSFYQSDWNKTGKKSQLPAVVALVFVKDRNKPPGIGDIQFHATLSTGLRPVGPVYRAVSVKDNKNERSTWLTARGGEAHENLDGQSILENVYSEIGDGIGRVALYIGVKKKRNVSIWLDKARSMTFLEFHEVVGGDEEYLYVNEWGIRTGDPFRFYVSDSNAALVSRKSVSDCFKQLNSNYADTADASTSKSNQQLIGDDANSKKMSVFGGMVFACCGRDESFFGHSNMDSSPFLENFPGIPVGGSFCSGELALVDKGIYEQEDEVQSAGRSGLHYFSTVYLVLSYTPARVQG